MKKLLLAAIILFPLVVCSAEISYSTIKISENCASILVNGEIKSGDAEKIEKYIKLNECTKSSIDPAISFNSNGGDVNEAFKIGRLIRNKNIGTFIDPENSCISACGLAFVGGVSRDVDGKFGVHRPFSLELSKGEENSEKNLEIISQSIKEYLQEMRISELYYDLMVRISPQDVKFLNKEQLQAFGIVGNDPVYEDVMLSKHAKELGITKMELISRKASIKEICGRGIRPYPDPCEDRVLRYGK